MQLSITGKFLAANPAKAVSEKLTVIEFWIDTTEGDYPNLAKFQAVKENVRDIVQKAKKGQEVEVKFAIKGRKYTNKDGKDSYIQNLEAYGVFVKTSTETPPVEQINNSSDDNLPF